MKYGECYVVTTNCCLLKPFANLEKYGHQKSPEQHLEVSSMWLPPNGEVQTCTRTGPKPSQLVQRYPCDLWKGFPTKF